MATVKIGLIQDVHYADTPKSPDSSPLKIYNDNSDKMQDFVPAMETWGADFLMCIGDFVDNTVTGTTAWDAGRAEYEDFDGDAYYTIGNHEESGIGVAQWKTDTGNSSTYCSFDVGGIHFVCLDNSTYEFDSTQRTWLTNDLSGITTPIFVFTHVDMHGTGTGYSETRTILQNNGNVEAVFSGHGHIGNINNTVSGINYHILYAFVNDEHPTLNYVKLYVDTDGDYYADGVGGQNDIGTPIATESNSPSASTSSSISSSPSPSSSPSSSASSSASTSVSGSPSSSVSSSPSPFIHTPWKNIKKNIVSWNIT